MTAPHLNDEEKVKIEVLAADGQSLKRIGKLVKRSPHTVQKHLEQPEVQQRVENEKEELAKIYRARPAASSTVSTIKTLKRPASNRRASAQACSSTNHCSSRETCHLSASRYSWPQ